MCLCNLCLYLHLWLIKYAQIRATCVIKTKTASSFTSAFAV